MPAWLHHLLEEQERNNAEKAPVLVPVLARLIDHDNEIKRAYLCHDNVRYISKINGEGHNFCGYHNIQMLLSFLQSASLEGCETLKGTLPSVLELQNMIEEAWDKRINDYGRIQTGGIRDTRKHIGTSEVCVASRSWL